MSINKLTALIVLATLSSSALAANSGFYLGGKVGASYLQSKDLQDKWEWGDNYDVDTVANKSKTVFNMGISAGYDFKFQYDLPIRMEIDYTYRSKAKINSIVDNYYFINGASGNDDSEPLEFKIKQTSLMVNSYYSFYNSSAFTPYVGFGLGTSFIKYQFEEDNLSKTNFAWSLNAGASYSITDNLIADLEYRYIDSGKIKDHDFEHGSDINLSAKLKTHDLSIGLRYVF